MIDRNREQSLHELIDGSASPEERARTQAWLAEDAAGRQRLRELEALFAALHAVPQVPAPEGLRDDVFRSIRAAGAPGRAPKLLRTAGIRLRWALVAPLAATLLIAVAFPWWRHALRPDTLPEVAGSLSGDLGTPGSARWNVGDAVVSVRVTGSQGTLVANFQVRSGHPVTLELFAGDAAFGASALQVESGPVTSSTSSHGLTLETSGSARFQLALPPSVPGAPVQLLIRSGDHLNRVVLPAPAASPPANR